MLVVLRVDDDDNGVSYVEGRYPGFIEVLDAIEAYVGLVTTIFIAFCGLLVVLFAIWIGWKLARAEDDGARKNARSQLVYSIIGLIVIGLVMALTQTVIETISIQAMLRREDFGDTYIVGALAVYEAISLIVRTVLQICITVAVLIGVVIGWQFMRAEDDGRRKNAKQQLLYAVGGLVAIVLINIVSTVILNALMTQARNRPT